MFKGTAVVFIGITSICSQTVVAEEYNYGGGSFSFLKYSETGVEDASLSMLSGRLGHHFSENIAGEVRVGIGVGDDTVNVEGIGVNLELDHMYGAYMRAGVPVKETFYPYAALGYTRGKLTASAFGVSFSDSETDVSFGLGVDAKVSEALFFNAEYMNYLDKDGVEISGFSLGFTKRF